MISHFRNLESLARDAFACEQDKNSVSQEWTVPQQFAGFYAQLKSRISTVNVHQNLAKLRRTP